MERRKENTMTQPKGAVRSRASRRAFLRSGIGAAGALTVGAEVLGNGLSAFAKEQHEGREERSSHITKGDAALLRFAAAAEILETDFWVQYNELGGVPDTKEVPGGKGSPVYTAALANLDADMAQYISTGSALCRAARPRDPVES